MMKRNQTVNELILIDGSLLTFKWIQIRNVFLLIPKRCSQRRAAMDGDPPYFIQTTYIDLCFCGHYSEARVPLTPVFMNVVTQELLERIPLTLTIFPLRVKDELERWQ